MADLHQVRTLFTGGGVTGGGVNTMHFWGSGGTAQQAVTAVGAFWNAVDPYMSSLVAWETDPEVSAIDDTTGNQIGVTITTPVNSAGTDSSGISTLQTQALVKLRTISIVGGRELRGRIFIPGIPKSLITSTGGVSTTLSSVVNTAAAALIADANSKLVVFSKTHFTSAEVLNALCWTKFADLASRRD
jgi:hypothetical protein